MSEQALWKWLSKLNEINEVDLQRIENPLRRGTLDVEGCAFGVSFWLELKAGPMPARVTSQVHCEPLKAEQIRFIERRLAAGGDVWVLYQVGSGNGSRRYLVPGKRVPLLGSLPTREQLQRCNAAFNDTPTRGHLLDAITHWSRLGDRRPRFK